MLSRHGWAGFCQGSPLAMLTLDAPSSVAGFRDGFPPKLGRPLGGFFFQADIARRVRACAGPLLRSRLCFCLSFSRALVVGFSPVRQRANYLTSPTGSCPTLAYPGAKSPRWHGWGGRTPSESGARYISAVLPLWFIGHLRGYACRSVRRCLRNDMLT